MCGISDWLHFGDWFDARDSCHNMSGTLVSIHSDAENSFVTNLIRKEPSWIGFSASHDDNWEWTDGTDVGYQRWDDGGILLQYNFVVTSKARPSFLLHTTQSLTTLETKRTAFKSMGIRVCGAISTGK